MSTSLPPSPLLALPGAVAAAAIAENAAEDTAASTAATQPADSAKDSAADIDAGLAWHYGDPLGEQRAATFGPVLLDRWTSGEIVVAGPDRLTWLHTISSQHFEGFAPGAASEALWLNPQGRILHWADVTVFGDAVHLRTEPGTTAALQAHLRSMVFRADVTIDDVSADVATLSIVGRGAAEAVETALGTTAPDPGTAAAAPPPLIMGKVAAGGYLRAYPGRVDVVVPRHTFATVAKALLEVDVQPGGTWAADALRIPARRPRFGVDNDARTLPNETNWLGTAVHMKKGCYPGQETIAKISNVGAPPRRIVVLNLDGSLGRLPETGDDVLTADGKKVGRVGTVAQHFEEGPIALALVKRTIDSEVALLAGGVDARVDPDDKTIVRRLVKTPAFMDFGRR